MSDGTSKYLGKDFNEYGTEISLHKCNNCEHEFTLCPPRPKWEDGCLSKECSSYNIKRDVNLLFGSEQEKNIKRRETGKYN